MRPPAFWRHDGMLARALAPLSVVTARTTARRVARPGWRAPVPVICCGNATVGGSGKTPLCLEIGARLPGAAFLTRGHGGQVRGVLRVDPARHDAALTGDEALLLAAVAPTYVAADRAAAARAAVAAGAGFLVMDDGLQNPALLRDLSLLVVDPAGLGNGRLLPAGPLRETLATAAARCQAVVAIGGDIPSLGPPTLRCDLVTEAVPGRLLAFAGIGRPEKFFAGLRAGGGEVVAAHPFPDHHPYARREIERLFDEAVRQGAILVTTAKDAVRLPADLRAGVRVATASLRWEDSAALDRLLARWR